MDTAVKSIMDIASQRIQKAQSAPKLTLPHKRMSESQLASLLGVLAQEYKTTLPILLRKLDRVSGNLMHLDRIYTNNEETLEWTPDQDNILFKNQQILIRWKGKDSVELRKIYLQSKNKMK